MYHPFSIAETLSAAWNVIKKNYISLIVYSIISLICYEAISFLTSFIVIYDNAYSQVAFVLFMMLVQSYLVLSFYKLILTLMDKEYYEFEFRDILPSLKMALTVVTIGILYTVLIATIIFLNLKIAEYDILRTILDKVEIVAVGYLLIRSIFCLCFVVDDDSGPVESLKQSFYITWNRFFKILFLILIAILFIAILLIIINVPITLFVDEDSSNRDNYIELARVIWLTLSFPTVQVMIMATYRKLVYSYKDIDDNVSEAL